MKNRDTFHSYSFSFQLKTGQDIRYFKKTNPDNPLNKIIENFILNFISSPIDNTTPIKRGRPEFKNKPIIMNQYKSFQLSLKKSTISKIKKYKKLGNNPKLDSNVEEYIKLTIPIREIR